MTHFMSIAVVLLSITSIYVLATWPSSKSDLYCCMIGCNNNIISYYGALLVIHIKFYVLLYNEITGTIRTNCLLLGCVINTF